MLELVWELIQKYNVTKVLVDASAPSFIRALKLEWGERSDYENVEKELRDCQYILHSKQYHNNYCRSLNRLL
jgi:hypothetical protein